jgi:uncharacterized protein YndB with AHSA1/START domain
MIETSPASEGRDIPPFLIVKGVWLLEDMCKQLDDSGVVLAVSNNGWTDDDLGFEWLKHFDKHTKDRSIGSYRMLILDGHGSHGTIQFVTYAYEHNIVLIYLPPHSTHRLQPLDVAVFGPLAKYYSDIVKTRSRYEGRGVSKREWMNWILEARKMANKEFNRKAV